MISFHNIKNKSSTSWVNGMKSSMFGSVIHQKSIKTYCQTQANLIKRPLIKQNDQKGIKQMVQKVNDQNYSFNANQMEIEERKVEIKTLSVLSNKISNDCKEEQRIKERSSSSQVVNLKKKIKKCSNYQMNKSQSYFRQKVVFIRKGLLRSKSQDEQLQNRQKDLMTQDKTQDKIQDKIQTYPVYRDRQVFRGFENKQLRNRIVVQRMDNDGETDDEQIEKFVHKIKTEFLNQIQKVKKQKQSAKSSKPVQEMDLNRVNQFKQQ